MINLVGFQNCWFSRAYTQIKLTSTRFHTLIEYIDKAKKKSVVFQVPCQKKTGSVGRFYFFFFTFFLYHIWYRNALWTVFH